MSGEEKASRGGVGDRLNKATGVGLTMKGKLCKDGREGVMEIGGRCTGRVKGQRCWSVEGPHEDSKARVQ